MLRNLFNRLLGCLYQCPQEDTLWGTSRMTARQPANTSALGLRWEHLTKRHRDFPLLAERFRENTGDLVDELGPGLV
jgi:hypothetical protein